MERPPEQPVFGRDAELGQLRACLERAISGHGNLVLIGGDAGIGKSTLVERLASDVAGRGGTVLTGTCYALEITPPYRPWADVVGGTPGTSALASLRASLFAGQEGRLSTDGRERWVSLCDALREVGSQQPLLIILEDMHWSDHASLDVLRFVGRQIRSLPVMIVMTYRDTELTQDQPLYRLLPQIVRESGALRMSLRQLDDQAVRAFLDATIPLPPDDASRLTSYLLERSEGNPFYIREFLATLELDGTLSCDDGVWHLGEISEHAVPYLVRQVIDDRLSLLDASILSLLHVAAVIGGEFSLDLWQEVSGADDDALGDAIEQSLRASILVERSGQAVLRFRHALIRQALYEQLVLPRRRSVHRRIAELLSQSETAVPDAVAYHFQQANDPRAADWLIEAGRHAARSIAHRDAVMFFEAADQLLEHDVQERLLRAWLMCELAEVYSYTDARRALRCLDTALQVSRDLDDPALDVVVHWGRGRLRGILGESALDEVSAAMKAFECLDVAKRERVQRSPVRVLVSKGTHAYWLAHHGRYQDALAYADSFLTTAANDRMVDYREQGLAHFARGIAFAGIGQPDAALAALGDVRTHFRRAAAGMVIATDPDWEYDTILHPYFPERSAERHRSSPGMASNWIQRIVGTDASPRITSPICDALIRSGQWGRAREVAQALAVADVQRVNSARTLAELDALQGFSDRAWLQIGMVLPAGPDTAPGSLYQVAILELQRIAVELALDAGDPARAERWIQARQCWIEWGDGYVPAMTTQEILRARLALHSGDRAAAHALASNALNLASTPRQPLAMLTAHRLLGQICGQMRWYDDALNHLSAARQLAVRCDAPWEQAVTAIALADVLHESGRSADVEPLLSEAREFATHLGATPILTRADALSQRLAEQRLPTTTPAGLSRRELEVLLLVAQGLTDAQIAEQLFISPRTVNGHLQSIYNKLGVSSRTAATAFAFANDLIQPITE